MILAFSEEDSRRIWQMMGNELAAWEKAVQEKRAMDIFVTILISLALSILAASQWSFLEETAEHLFSH